MLGSKVMIIHGEKSIFSDFADYLKERGMCEQCVKLTIARLVTYFMRWGHSFWPGTN